MGAFGLSDYQGQAPAAYDYSAGGKGNYQYNYNDNYNYNSGKSLTEMERELQAMYKMYDNMGGFRDNGAESDIEGKSGYGGYHPMPPPKPKVQTKYVPIVVKKKKKKQKIVSINKGVFVRGGIQVFGKFKSLKACMKACGATPTCFAGDYNPWLGKCYFHSNTTACNNMASHSKITHFKKVPCEVTDAPRGRIILGAMHHATTFQKGVDSLSTCLKKCAGAGMGISSAVPVDLAATAILGNLPLCYGINYDFGTHKCYWITNLHPRLPDAVRTIFSICPLTAAIDVRVPVDLQPNPSVITVILCPIRTTPAG